MTRMSFNSAFHLRTWLVLMTTALTGIAVAPAQETNPTPNAPTPIEVHLDSNALAIDPANLEPLIQPANPTSQPGIFGFEIPQQLIEVIDFRDQELGEAMRLFSEQTDINIVPSTDANEMKVNLYLRNVRPMDVLENLTKAHDLYYRIDEDSGIIRIYTTEEYEENLTSFREEQTQVFTLLYPNPVDAAVAIRNLFGDRVELNFGVGDQASVLDLIYRLNRFDLVDSRSLGLGSYQGDYAYGGRSFSRLGGLGGFTGNIADQNASSRFNDETAPLSDLSADQIQRLITAVNNRGDSLEPKLESADPIAKLLKERNATIYVTVIRRNNQVVVRTGDKATMEQIAILIQSLDVPTPLVLLEVKVMSVLLDDQFRSVFDYQFADNDWAGGFTTGDILPPPVTAIPGNAKKFASMIPGGSIINQGDLTFQFVNNTFRARMQLLEDDNRVTILNTPLLLTANNEVSRIFIGETVPFTVGFNAPQIIAGTVSTTIAGTPITELRDVGQSLLITPSINADRTVTLRIVQENSLRVINGATIPVVSATGEGLTQEVEVDTVNRSTISGTVVAKDGLAVVLGGLIEERITDDREKVPGLGKIPGLGFFFRRQNSGRFRRELVIMIRPYIFNTPSESASISQDLMQELSVHPSVFNCQPTLQTFGPHEVLQVDLDQCGLHEIFNFHNVVPRVY